MLIECQHINKFVKGAQILRDVSFNLGKGENVVITGHSGSGKSSFLNVLSLLSQPSSGLYFLDGKLVTQLKMGEIRSMRTSMIGIVFQKFFLVSYLTIRQNILLPLYFKKNTITADDKRAADALLERMNIVDKADQLPNQLSGGQQQRACIARALITKPKILFADEPTGNLDSENTRIVLDLFRDLQGSEHSIVIVTHDEEVAKLFPRHIHIKDGMIVKDVTKI